MLSLALFHFYLFFSQNEGACLYSNTFAETYTFISKMESFFERDVYLLNSPVQRSTLFRSKVYCCSNGLMSLMQNTLWFLKNALLSKGYVKHWQYISYFTHGSDRFGLWYIIFLQVKYCLSVNSSKVFKTKTKFSLASNSAIVGVYMSKNQNDTGNYFHNNKEHQKLVKISISENLY